MARQAAPRRSRAVFGRVLVVEDHGGAARGLRALLTSRGYRVDVAGSTAEALRRARRHRHNLVVADFDLGDEDGVELVRALRRLRPGMPVMGVTGRDLGHTATLLGELRLEELLQKPVDPALLLEAINKIGVKS